VDGNAAIYYLKAMGFLEQTSARDELSRIQKEAGERAGREGKDYGQVVPPYRWLSLAPQELPREEVKQFLQLTSFQPQFLREAAKRRRMDLDRQIREVDNPLGYLLPDIQSMRELARTQSLRCKLAIAEGRIEDAVAILGQQYAMARHLGQDEFLVSNLVGIACAGIAWEDALYLVQHPNAPNLYWAFAALPRPFVDQRQAMAFERQLLYEQVKVLREVGETPRPAGYWQDFVERLTPQLEGLASEFNASAAWKDPQTARAAVVGFVVAAYPGAKRFLIEECGLPRETVEAYPTAQVVFLAVVRYYDQARDDFFKWFFVPYWHTTAGAANARLDDMLRAKSEQVGWCAVPTDVLLPAVAAAATAAARAQQSIALVQTVEAIRMYGAAHEGKLPSTLSELPVPAPLEPFTGQPLDYECQGDRAILTGHRVPGLQYRLVLRFAKSSPQ